MRSVRLRREEAAPRAPVATKFEPMGWTDAL
jgi:hypothetical protein